MLNALAPSADPSIIADNVPLSLLHALVILFVLMPVVESYRLAVVVFKLCPALIPPPVASVAPCANLLVSCELVDNVKLLPDKLVGAAGTSSNANMVCTLSDWTVKSGCPVAVSVNV